MSCDRAREITKSGISKAELFGGTDAGEWKNYKRIEDRGYADNPDHFARSLFHSPNHIRHKHNVLDN